MKGFKIFIHFTIMQPTHINISEEVIVHCRKDKENILVYFCNDDNKEIINYHIHDSFSKVSFVCENANVCAASFCHQ